MARTRGRYRDKSPSSESFHVVSDASSSDSETEISSPEPPSSSSRISYSRASRVGKRRRSRASFDEGKGDCARQPKRAKNSRSGEPPVDFSTVQEQNARQRHTSSSISSDTDRDDSATDPDIESDNTSSDSGDDGYADGTREMIARMRDRWERYVKPSREVRSEAHDHPKKDLAGSSIRRNSCLLIQSGPTQTSLFELQERGNSHYSFAGASSSGVARMGDD